MVDLFRGRRGIPECLCKFIENPAELGGAFKAAKEWAISLIRGIESTMVNLPLVNNQQIINVQLDTKDQADDK